MVAAILYNLKGLLLVCAGIFGIGVLVAVHEFGHYVFARLFGVRVPSFSIGMGPKLFSFKAAGTEFLLSAIPVGGYCEIAGLAEVGQGEQAYAQETGETSFSSKPFWQKACILGGGIFFNFIMAYLVFVFLFSVGMPESPMLNQDTMRPMVSAIEKNSAAEKIGLTPNDTIIAINKVSTPTILEFGKQFAEHREHPLTITFLHKDQVIEQTVQLGTNERLGINGYVCGTLPAVSLGKSFKAALEYTWVITRNVCTVFVNLFKRRSMQGLGGPLMIISQMATSAKQGFVAFLFFLAFIGINIALINLIPLPITDGGQIVLTGIEAVIRRPLPEQVRLWLAYASWGLILLLTLYLTVKDAIILFWPTIKNWLTRI